MDINNILSGKTGAKEKTSLLAKALTDKEITFQELKSLAEKSKDPVKATCIEAVEYVTAKDPSIISEEFFEFVCAQLQSKAPRIKWESAKVIANTVHHFPNKIDLAIPNLLSNSEHEGTVVRWSAATALSAILLLKSSINDDLIPGIKAIMAREDKPSINKIYSAALKKVL